ncbi:hypothetical protein ACJX0J_019553, partial [Zea mays]
GHSLSRAHGGRQTARRQTGRRQCRPSRLTGSRPAADCQRPGVHTFCRSRPHPAPRPWPQIPSANPILLARPFHTPPAPLPSPPCSSPRLHHPRPTSRPHPRKSRRAPEILAPPPPQTLPYLPPRSQVGERVGQEGSTQTSRSAVMTGDTAEEGSSPSPVTRRSSMEGTTRRRGPWDGVVAGAAPRTEGLPVPARDNVGRRACVPVTGRAPGPEEGARQVPRTIWSSIHAPADRDLLARPPCESNVTVLVSRSHAYHRRGLWAIKAKHGGAFLKAEMPVVVAEPKFYPADNTKPRKPSTRKPKPRSLEKFDDKYFIMRIIPHAVYIRNNIVPYFIIIENHFWLSRGDFWTLFFVQPFTVMVKEHRDTR